jgi:RNA polymerase sigma factor (TIGR02999 family)
MTAMALLVRVAADVTSRSDILAPRMWRSPARIDLTVLLNDWIQGDQDALDQLLPHVYSDLHGLASAYLRRGATPVTLQTTAVVNDLFVTLLTRQPARLSSRRHFYALAARVIRMSLVDHYRERQAQRRGGDQQRVPLHPDLVWVDANSEDAIALDEALTELEALDREQAELFSARFLLGCTSEETAALTGLSKATIDRRVRLARGWLFGRLRGSRPRAKSASG